MSEKSSQINLISELPEIAKAKLSSDSYGFLEYNFGLDGAATPDEVRRNIGSIDSKSEIKKFLGVFSDFMKALIQDENCKPIIEELQLLKADLIGSKNYVDNFNTEEKLIARLNTHYNQEGLTPAQMGIALVIFYLLKFERIDLAGCQVFWKLTDNDVTIPVLQTLHQTVNEILNSKPDPIEISILRRRIADKRRDKKMPDEALLRFILSVDNNIEVLREQSAVQIKFSGLKTVPQMIYRVLSENGKPMKIPELELEIGNRLKLFGRATPAIRPVLSSNEIFVQAADGWGLNTWEMKVHRALPELLKEWFQETNKPATRNEMTSYLQPLRPDLKSIYNKVVTYKEIILVEYIQAELNRGKAELYFYKGLPLPEGIKPKRNSAKSSSGSTKKITNLPKLFISYSHADEKWRKEFRKYFDPAQKNQLLEIWDDKLIPSGVDWHNEINNGLNTADAALFLVTQDFLNSDFITDEELPILMKRAKKGQIKIYWVMVESCLFDRSPLAKLQATNLVSEPLYGMKGDRKKAAITDICRRIISEITSS